MKIKNIATAILLGSALLLVSCGGGGSTADSGSGPGPDACAQNPQAPGCQEPPVNPCIANPDLAECQAPEANPPVSELNETVTEDYANDEFNSFVTSIMAVEVDSQGRSVVLANQAGNPIVMRFNAAGALDVSFDAPPGDLLNWATVSPGVFSPSNFLAEYGIDDIQLVDLALGADDSIYVLGKAVYFQDNPSPAPDPGLEWLNVTRSSLLLMKVNSDGTRDGSFGNAGFPNNTLGTTLDIFPNILPQELFSGKLSSSGKSLIIDGTNIYVAVEYERLLDLNENPFLYTANIIKRTALLKFDLNGKLVEEGFADSGVARFDPNDAPFSDNDIVAQDLHKSIDGRLLLLSRLDGNRSLLQSYSTAGLLTVDYGESSEGYAITDANARNMRLAVDTNNNSFIIGSLGDAEERLFVSALLGNGLFNANFGEFIEAGEDAGEVPDQRLAFSDGDGNAQDFADAMIYGDSLYILSTVYRAGGDPLGQAFAIFQINLETNQIVGQKIIEEVNADQDVGEAWTLSFDDQERLIVFGTYRVGGVEDKMFIKILE